MSSSLADKLATSRDFVGFVIMDVTANLVPR